MAKAYAYIANNTPQTLTGGGAILPGTAQHGFGCACGQKIISVAGNNINLKAGGYYNIDIGATVTNSEAGDVTLSLYQDGSLIASGTESIAAAADPASISFSSGVLVNCSSTLTLVVTATAGNPTVNNVYTTIQKM